MVKKKEIGGKWIVIDSDDHIFNYPNFTDSIGMMISMTIGMETGDGLILILMKTENSLR